MKLAKITASIPASLERAMRLQIRQWHYTGELDYGLGLILWDVYSRQSHTTTGPMMKWRRRAIEGAAYDLAEELGMADPEARKLVPYRLGVKVPAVLRTAVKIRIVEEGYKGGSAYLTALVFFSLKVRKPDMRKVPHHKCAPLLREPEWVREEAFAHFAKEFDNPARKWPKHLLSRIDETIGGEPGK